MTKEEEIKSLIRRSKSFLETADFQTSRGFYDLAAFSLEQAIQLHLKARLLAEGIDYPRTHSVRTLLRMLSELASEEKKIQIKKVMENYLLELGLLEDAYITSRYITREFTKEELEKLAKAVKEIIKNVQ